ncbi:D-tyrosyl-tRNA(Tyr) deacylase, partial [Cucurbita argyrosperma subsp. argyrosperma]
MNSVAYLPLFAASVGTKRTTVFSNKRKIQPIRSMRAVVQRVASASVEVDGRTVSEIGPGLLVLVGLHDSDSESDAEYICRKVLNMRLFPNQSTGKAWDLNVMQKNYEVLLESIHLLTIPGGWQPVSQFTLYGMLKGNKPTFMWQCLPKSQTLLCFCGREVNLVNDGQSQVMQIESQPSKDQSKPQRLC